MRPATHTVVMMMLWVCCASAQELQQPAQPAGGSTVQQPAQTVGGGAVQQQPAQTVVGGTEQQAPRKRKGMHEWFLRHRPLVAPKKTPGPSIIQSE